jgi:hypothetical protein
MDLGKRSRDKCLRFKGAWISKISPLFIIIFLISLTIIPFASIIGSGEGDHTRLIEGRTKTSNGLPKEASFTTVEVFDTDFDGLDEIYLGGAGRGSPKTPGIHAYEYNLSLNKWNEFGHGLAGEDSGKYYGAISLGDVDNDGNIDLIAPLLTKWYDGNMNGIELYAGDNAGGFSLEYTIDTGESVNEADVKDLDNDGNMDIAVSTESALRVWYGSGTLDVWTEKSPPKSGNEFTGIDSGDLNGDGLLDLVGCPYFGSTKVRMYIQSSDRTWEEISFKEVRNEGFGIKIADLDSDGNQDIIYGTRNEGIKAWLGNSGGSKGGIDFQWRDGSAGLHDSGGQWQQLELQDITGDGKPELIAANNGGDEVYLYINDYPNGWTWIFRGDSDSDMAILKEDPLIIGGEPYGANFGDWDGDGHLDCAAGSWGTGVKAWLINDNVTNQTEQIEYPEGGKTPPQIWGYDDYFYLTVFLLLGLGAAGFTAIAASFRASYIKRNMNNMNGIENREDKRDEIWHLIRGNVLIIIGIVFLIIFQILGIVFSISYGSDSNIFSFWYPPEFLGILVYSFFGFVTFIICLEVGMTYSRKGIYNLDKMTFDDSILSKTISISRKFLLLVNIVMYIGIIILFVLTINFFYTHGGIDYIILLYIGLMPLAIFLFNYSINIIPIKTGKTRVIPLVTLITYFLIVLVTVIFSIYILVLGADIMNLMLFYPLIYSIFILVWTVLNIITLRRFRTSFVRDKKEENSISGLSHSTNTQEGR